MKLPGGFEISDSLLTQFPVFIFIFLTIIALSAIKIAFGKEIIWLFDYIKKGLTRRVKIKKHNEWIAICIEREGWRQKGDAEALDLEGKYLKKLSFSVSPIGKPENWRGGFILGNEKFHPQLIVDSKNAITIHTGRPPSIVMAQHIWMYDWNYTINHPNSTTVKLLNKNKLKFDININDNNFLSVHVNNQQVYSNKIDSSYRKKIYLICWGDHANCKVRFSDITYTI